ncbi:hypothetical protein BASA50_009307 [Batrachochytrium salamandrivorans]|uniref:Secreted protein n=1 Tax=Batrachochytrium salamandrivorans TaxID=1357716 RepID=A0ABQ8F2A9_9FUNG|nr:hypothetical protein BASA50_009307 [Batrachochytrium salamandrivorans]
MRVKVLVAAAMVITSVNASGKGGFKGWFGRGSMTGQNRDITYYVSLSQGPEPTKKKPGDGSGGDGKDPFCDPMPPNYLVFMTKLLRFLLTFRDRGRSLAN